MCNHGKFLGCLNNQICGPSIQAIIVAKEGATREQKLHHGSKDPKLQKYNVKIMILQKAMYVCVSFAYSANLWVLQSVITRPRPISVKLVVKRMVKNIIVILN